MQIELSHPGRRGSTVFEIRPEGHEVWMTHPIRTEYGSSRWRNRFTAAEAREVAAALAQAADEADAAAPRPRQ